MNLVRFNSSRPFGNLMSRHNRMNRLFENAFWGTPEKETDTLAGRQPTTDIYETADDYVFKLEVPGIKKENITIEFKDNTLFIKGERKEEKEVKEEDYHRVESYSGTFARNFQLPENIDAKKIDAVLKNGILTLKVAKAEEKKPKEIPIAFN